MRIDVKGTFAYVKAFLLAAYKRIFTDRDPLFLPSDLPSCFAIFRYVLLIRFST